MEDDSRHAHPGRRSADRVGPAGGGPHGAHARGGPGARLATGPLLAGPGLIVSVGRADLAAEELAALRRLDPAWRPSGSPSVDGPLKPAIMAALDYHPHTCQDREPMRMARVCSVITLITALALVLLVASVADSQSSGHHHRDPRACSPRSGRTRRRHQARHAARGREDEGQPREDGLQGGLRALRRPGQARRRGRQRKEHHRRQGTSWW